MKCSRCLRWAALGVAFCSASALAEYRDYLGGSWHNAGSWSPAGVPTADDILNLPAEHAGDVFIGGGFTTREMTLNDGYTIRGDNTSVGRALVINSNGPNNIIDVATLTGQPFEGGYAISIGAFFGEVEVRSSLADPGAGDPLDAYVTGDFTRPNVHSGLTRIVGTTRLKEQGTFGGSAVIDITKAPLYIENPGAFGGNERLYDAATVRLTSGFFSYVGGGVEERIGGIDLREGNSRVTLFESQLVAGDGGALHRDPFRHGTMTLEAGGGALRVAPAGIGLGDAIIPWATVFDLPAFYNSGADLIPGTIDDGGFEQASTTDLAFVQPDENAFVWGPESVGASKTMQTLTVGVDATLTLTTNPLLTLSKGALVMQQNSKIDRTIGGSIAFQGPEAFVHVPSVFGKATIAATLSSSTGLVKGGPGTLVLAAPMGISGGPMVVNGGRLELAVPNALPGSTEIRLVEASLFFDTVGGAIPNPITLDLGSATPFSQGGYISEIKFRDNQNYTLSGLIQGRGAFNIVGENSRITVSGVHNSTTPFPGEGFVFWNYGNVNVEVTGRLGDQNNRATVVLFTGKLTGTGEVSGGIQISSGGTFAPGLNGGSGVALFKTGDVGMFDGRIEMQVNGTARGSTYDAIDAGFGFFGTGGTIAITGSRTGQIGDKYELISYASGFAFGGGPTIANALAVQNGGQWVKWFDHDGFTLAVAGPTGDATLDGRVDFADLLAMAQNYGLTGNWSTGDFSGDGLINFDDLLLIAQHYGQSAISAQGREFDFSADWALARSVAPEPASLGLLACGTTLRCRRG